MNYWQLAILTLIGLLMVLSPWLAPLVRSEDSEPCGPAPAAIERLIEDEEILDDYEP